MDLSPSVLRESITAHINKLRSKEIISDKDHRALQKALGDIGTEDDRNYFREEINTIRDVHEKDLEPLFNWIRQGPQIDPDHFINTGKKNRFAVSGFKKYVTEYKRTATWDWQPIEVGILVPAERDLNKELAVHVKWHGGGFTTGDWEFEPWFADHLLPQTKGNNAIIIAPNYRLMPEASGKNILEDVEDFWKWYNNGAFTLWINTQISGIKINRSQLLVSGDSAGAFLAVYSWLKVPDLPIRALYLQYPMFRYYKRDFPKDERGGPETKSLEYMGKLVQQSEVKMQADLLLDKITELENIGQCPTVTKGRPPLRMLAGFTLSTTGTWETLFRRGDNTMDILGMIRDRSFEPKSFPTMFIYHAHDDINCPVQDTETFIQACKERWSNNYRNGKGGRIHFTIVERLFEKNGTEGPTTSIGHGFDHNLELEKEPFLKEIWKGVLEEWGWNREDEKVAATSFEAKENARKRRVAAGT